MSTSAARSTYHHGDLRNALLAAGADAAREIGAEQLSLREVARRAGVSHAAAYNHFADKKDLLRGLAIRAFEDLAVELRRAGEHETGGLDDLAVAYLRFAMSRPAEFRFMFQRSLCMPDGVPDPLEEASRAAEHALVEKIVRLQAGGRLRAGDPAAVALVVWSQVHGITTIVLETPAFKSIARRDAEGLVRQTVQALVRGLGPGA